MTETAGADWTVPTGLGTSAARLAALLTVDRAGPPPADVPGPVTGAVTAPPGAGLVSAPPGAVFSPPAAGVVSPSPAAVPGPPVASGVGVRSGPALVAPGYLERPWGDGSAKPLYVPVAERVDDVLTAVVEDMLVEWAEGCGFEGGELDHLRGAGFGRLAVLTHVDTDDPDRLLIAAKLNAAWWAADDLYADDSGMGAEPTELPPRLALVMAAMDPVAPASEFSVPLEEALRSDVVLRALRSGVDHLSRYATPSVVQRANYATFAMFVSWNSYAAWRHTGQYPPAWKYLATRQHDSFYTSMTLIDAVGGYEVPANLYYEPNVRRATMLAGTASVVVNDLLSVAKDAADEKPVCNMVLQVAADRGCSVEDATEAVVDLHNRLVRDFEELHRGLLAVPSPDLQRFLRGLRSWMGGGFEWHNTNPRYRT